MAIPSKKTEMFLCVETLHDAPNFRNGYGEEKVHAVQKYTDKCNQVVVGSSPSSPALFIVDVAELADAQG